MLESQLYLEHVQGKGMFTEDEVIPRNAIPSLSAEGTCSQVGSDHPGSLLDKAMGLSSQQVLRHMPCGLNSAAYVAPHPSQHGHRGYNPLGYRKLPDNTPQVPSSVYQAPPLPPRRSCRLGAEGRPSGPGDASVHLAVLFPQLFPQELSLKEMASGQS